MLRGKPVKIRSSERERSRLNIYLILIVTLRQVNAFLRIVEGAKRKPKKRSVATSTDDVEFADTCREGGFVNLRRALYDFFFNFSMLRFADAAELQQFEYVCMVTHIARVWINRLRLPILVVVS